MTSDDENPTKKSLNPLEDLELDDQEGAIDEDLEDVDEIEEIIDASPLGSELDSEDYAGDDDTDFAAELSAMPNDDIDTDVDSTPSFDTGSVKRGGKKSGGMKKMMAPALVLVIAAGAAGYIMMNPAILGGEDAQTPAITATSPAGDFAAEAEALRQAQTVSDAPQETGLGGMGTDLPQPPVNMNEQNEAPQESDTARLSPDETITDIMNAGDEMSEAMGSGDNEMETEIAANDNAAEFENDLPEEVSVEPPAMDMPEMNEVDTIDVVRNEAPATAPQEMAAEPVMPVEKEPVMEQGSGENMMPTEMAQADGQGIASDENDIFERDFQNIVDEGGNGSSASNTQRTTQQAAPQDDDSFYDSEMRVPQGQVSGPRKLDPRIEPATTVVVAEGVHKADDQESLVVAANRALKLRRYDAALDMFGGLYSKNKRDKRILMGLAVAQQNTGRVESAIKTYEELLDIDPDNTDALVNMLGLIKEQYPSVALRRLMNLQQQFPNHAGLAAQIGVTQADLGQYQDAMRYLGMAASLEPQNPQHLFNLAIIADRQRMNKQAINFYEQALEVDTVYTSGRELPRETIYDRLSTLRRR